MKRKASRYSDAPLFFLPVPLFFELWHGYQRGSVVKALEVEGSPLPLDKKTLRKLSAGGFLSKRSAAKFLAWPPIVSIMEKLDIDRMIGTRLGETMWRGGLAGTQDGGFDENFPKTIGYVYSLLDAEAEAVKASWQQAEDHLRYQYYYTSRYYQRYGLPFHDGDFTCQPFKFSHWSLQSRIATLHGIISLQMDVIARAEVEWFEQNRHLLSENVQFQSYIVHLLPAFLLKNGVRQAEVVNPIEALLRLFRDNLDYSTWKELESCVPVEGRDDCQLESQHRVFVRWRGGKKIPASCSVRQFFRKAIQEKGEDPDGNCFWLVLFSVAVFMSRLLNFIQEEAPSDIPLENIIAAFATYQEHFDRHVAEATRNQVTP